MNQACTILAHRGNRHGPDPAAENTPAAYAAALADGFGLEIDVRRDTAGRWYVSHDPAPVGPGNELGGFAALFRRHASQVVAVNVKELPSASDLAALVRRGIFGDRAFLFDFELLEPATPGHTQRVLAAAGPDQRVPLAARMSDRAEPVEQCLAIPAAHVWADEFDGAWLTGAAVRRAREAGRRVWAISPELHGRDTPERRARWSDFKRWGVDGLCTDFAVEARDFFCN